MGSRKSRVVVVLAILVLASCAFGQEIFEGQTGDGSLYELAMPADWKGILVVYAHGIIDPQLPVAIPGGDVTTLRDGLLANGFAVAYSSYASNGYAVKDGMQRTHQLKGLFTAHFSAPRKTILMGHSLGGLVVLALAEKYPAQYDGALPMCGVVGGSVPEINYVSTGRALYDLFFSSEHLGAFPYTLPGDAGNPVDLDFSPGSAAFNGVLENLTLGYQAPFLTAQYAATIPIPVDQTNPSETIAGLMNLVGFHVRFGSDLIERTHDRIPFDNSTVVYSDPLYPPANAAINNYVERYTASPDALNYIRNYYTPTGNLKIPVLTVHTTRDPVVPIWHEDLLKAAATAAGSSDMLVQTKIPAFGHCNFTEQDTFTAFQKLIGWVEFGVKPQP
jgi:pimeloyl-ACP methyl ester carboxylesterase